MSLARTGVASTLCFSPRQSFGRLLLCLRALKTRGAIAGGLQHVPVLSAPLPAPQQARRGPRTLFMRLPLGAGNPLAPSHVRTTSAKQLAKPIWAPTPSSASLDRGRLERTMTGKQRTLAAVWGGSRGAVTSPGGGAGSPADSAPSRKRDRDESAEAGAAGPSPPKRLRRADGDQAGVQAPSPAGAASTAGAAGLEDDVEEEGGKGVEARGDAGGRQRAVPATARHGRGKMGDVGDEDSEDAGGYGDDSGDEAESDAEEAEGAKGRAKGGSGRRATGAEAGGGRGGAQTLVLAREYASCDVDAAVTWTRGQPIPYEYLADVLEEVAEMSSQGRLAKTGVLTRTFRAVLKAAPEELLPMVYLCANRVAPAHEGIELGIGDATLIKALAGATGRSEKQVKQDYAEKGDLGTLAVASRNTQKTLFKQKRLTVQGVFKAFRDIATTQGQGSQTRKQGAIAKLLSASQGNEAGYIMRSLQGKLRIGLADQTLLAALAHAALLHHMEKRGEALRGEQLAERMVRAEGIVKKAYSDLPSFDLVVPPLAEYGPDALPEHCTFRPGLPVKPMLAKATTAVQEVLDKFEGREFTCEYKYDGERAQVHVMDHGRAVKIYSRNLEDMTGKYPDIVARVPRALAEGTESVVLDCEAVAWDAAAGKILPFQVLSKRARKDVTVESIKVQVILYAFDCLYRNGEPLLDRPLTERRAALYSSVRPVPGEVAFAEARTSNDLEELTRFLDDAVVASTEGLIVKTLSDPYEPSKRSLNWLKLKKDYLNTVGDTIDAVPIGAWYGRGKRTGVYGSFLLAIYDPESEEYQTLCKIGTGFSEQDLEAFSQQLRDKEIDKPRPYYRYGETLVPQVWFEPRLVWEIKAADLSLSPVHCAAVGVVDPTRGVSVRFPRLLRVRDDKGPEGATTPEQIADMYRSQAVYSNAGAKDTGGGE